MSGHYLPSGHTSSSSNSSIPPQYYDNNPYAPTLPENPFHPTAAATAAASYVPYADALGPPGYVDQFEDASSHMGSVPAGSGRARRRTVVSGEQVKHRRTRSGCFTCRQRRVKCDETHPTCERCRKANRECKYPESQSGQRAARSGAKSGKTSSADSTSSPEDLDEAGGERLPPIHDDDEDEEEDIEPKDDVASRSQHARDSPSHTPRSILDQSTSPSTEASSTVPPTVRPSLSRKGSAQATQAAPMVKGSSAMARDLPFYLNYFQAHVTVHHYSLKRDTGNFLKGEFLAHAMRFEPLKYAVAGFAAYFHTLSQPDGRMANFLQFYNESVSRLRISITKNKKHGLSTFLTILQLASIEEMLGDWVNLMGHQKAAFEMLTHLYTPQSITESDFLLKVFSWYIRFDLFVGFQSGSEAVLGREWYAAVHARYAQKMGEHGENVVGMQYEERFAYSRMVAKDSNDLFARTSKGLISPYDFMQQLPRLREQVEGLQKGVFPNLLHPSYQVPFIPGSAEPTDIVDPYEPNLIWKGPLWTTNYLFLDTWGIIFMFNISVSMALKQPLNPEVAKLAYRAIQVFEAMCTYPDAPPGTILEAQVCFAIATLFLPKDAKTVSWCRKRFAKIEAAGYIYSDVLRSRMLESMGVGPSDWWLPDDEACPPMIRSIKDFIKDRTLAPRDQVSDDLREMRGIFNTMTIGDSPPSDGMTATRADSVGSTSAQASEQ